MNPPIGDQAHTSSTSSFRNYPYCQKSQNKLFIWGYQDLASEPTDRLLILWILEDFIFDIGEPLEQVKNNEKTMQNSLSSPHPVSSHQGAASPIPDSPTSVTNLRGPPIRHLK